MKILCSTLLMLFLVSASASAEVVGMFDEVTSEAATSPPAGFITSDLTIDSTTDWLAANLVLTLTSGSIYQDSLISGIGPPSDALVGAIPSTRWDTYVTGSLGLAGGSPASAGGAVDLGGSAIAEFDASGINLNWFTTSTTDIGSFTIGRFTLTDDAVGTFSLRLDSLQQSAPFYLTGMIEDGHFVAVPEVGSFVLMGIGFVGMVSARRLKRHAVMAR